MNQTDDTPRVDLEKQFPGTAWKSTAGFDPVSTGVEEFFGVRRSTGSGTNAEHVAEGAKPAQRDETVRCDPAGCSSCNQRH